MPAPTYVQKTSGGGNTWTLGSPSTNFTIDTADDFIVVIISTSPDSGGQVPTVADTKGNTWIPLVAIGNFAIYYCVANASGSDTLNLNQPGTAIGTPEMGFTIIEVSGSIASPVVASTQGNGVAASGQIGLISASLPIATSTPINYTLAFLSFPGSSGTQLLLAVVGSESTITDPSGKTSGSFLGLFTGASYEQVWAYVPVNPPTPTSDVVTDICVRAGLATSQIDVSLLTDTYISPNATVQGFLSERPQPAVSLLKVLMETYFFDACESDGKIKFIPRGFSSAMSIPESDLGLASDKGKLTETTKQELDLPRRVMVMFNDPALNYQQNKQEKQRNSRLITTVQEIVKSIPMTMDLNWAAQVAEKTLYLEWLERNSYVFTLWRAIYLRLDPTDVITFTYEGLTFIIRIVENSIGKGLAVEIQGVNENANNYQSTKQGAANLGFIPPSIGVAGATQIYFLDIPLLRDIDANAGGTGFYFAAGSQVSRWQGMILEVAPDDSSYQDLSESSTPMSYGVTTTTLGAPRSPWDLDGVNTVTVQVKEGNFASDTFANVLNGSNAVIVGSEIIQYTTSVDNGDGTVTLSGLLRGQRGTEWACGTHSTGEIAIALSVGVVHVDDPISLIGQLRYYRAVTIGQDITSAATQQFTLSGADLKPYAPAGIGGTASGSDITITWDRRTRIGGEADWGDGVTDVPLSEDSESYDLEVMNGSTVVRTVTAINTPTFIYTAAMQTADFGSTQTSVTVNVYQRSAQVGRGFKATGVAPTPGGWPVPWPSTISGVAGGGTFYVNGS
jgi:Putative phage tail protein